MPRIVRCGLIQASNALPPTDKQTSLEAIKSAMIEKHIPMIEDAGKRGVQILCLQELFYGPYFCAEQDPRWYKMTERVPDGPTIKRMAELAKKHQMVMVVPVYEEEMTGVYYNTAAVIDADGKYLGKYRKTHIPHCLPGFWEKFYFTPGDLGFRAWQTKYAKIGVLVCWDQWYPEGARLTALQGAEILFYPTAIGWHPGEKKKYGALQHDAWETIQRSHAIANGCYVCVPNRVGHEVIKGVGGEGIEFWGQSFVAGTSGQILAKAGPEKEETLIVPLDLKNVDTTRTHWPFLRDRRIDAYGGITKRLLD